MAKPILVVRLNFMTPREQIDGFQKVIEEKCDDYHIFCLASQNPELSFEVHAVDQDAEVKKFEDLRKELVNQFKTQQDEQANNDKGGAVVSMPVSSKGADS